MRWLDGWIHNPEEETAEWIAKARTPGARARIRRWSRVERVGVVVTVAALLVLFLTPFATLIVAVWFAVTGAARTDVYAWLWALPLSAALLGALVMTVGERRRTTAQFEDAYHRVGRVDSVVEDPVVDDDQTWWILRISAQLPDGRMIRRKLYRDGNDPQRRVGEPIRFRHNTLDPDDLHDILFEGFGGDADADTGL